MAVFQKKILDFSAPTGARKSFEHRILPGKVDVCAIAALPVTCATLDRHPFSTGSFSKIFTATYPSSNLQCRCSHARRRRHVWWRRHVWRRHVRWRRHTNPSASRSTASPRIMEIRIHRVDNITVSLREALALSPARWRGHANSS